MALYDHARMDATAGIGGQISTLAARFAGIVIAFAETVSDWNDARITRRALSKLSDHELDDIGLTRSDLERFKHF